MQGIFITGTNTDVGKTYISVLLAGQLSEQGINIIPRKPVESGCTKYNDELIPHDANALKQAAHYQGPLSDICSYRFEPAVSPVRAAQLASTIVTTEQLVHSCLQGSEKGFLLVEGAGGFYSPLTENGLNADLAEALQLPIILVAEDCLGCINQVLLSAEAINNRGLKLAAVIVNKLGSQNSEIMDNVADLREALDCPIYSLPYKPEAINAELPADLIKRVLSI